MPKPFPILIEVEEVALGKVMRSLHTMPGVIKIYMDMDQAGAAAPKSGRGGAMVHYEHLKAGAVHEISGVSASTIHNWFDGDTRRPNNATVMAVASSLGYGRRDEITKDGRVVPGFAKLRDLDYQKEIEKPGRFHFEAEQRAKKKRERKLNGHAK